MIAAVILMFLIIIVSVMLGSAYIAVGAMLFIVFLSALLTVGEGALVAISDQKVNQDAEAGNRRALKVQMFTKNANAYMTSIQIWKTLLALANGAIALDIFRYDVMAWFGTPGVVLEIVSVVIIILIILFFHVVFGQLIARRLAAKQAEILAYVLVGFIGFMHGLMRPVAWFFRQMSNVLGRLFGLHPSEQGRHLTEEEIRTIVEASTKTGAIDHEESVMINNIFEFDDTYVSEIMTHRTEISALDVKTTKTKVMDFINAEQYTRFPVYEGNLDHIIGTLHVKDLLKHMAEKNGRLNLTSIIRKPLFVPESMKTSRLFKDMQKSKNHIAIVLDEFGGTAGIVTIEDLIEEIVGNIFDEFDDVEIDIVKVDDHQYEIDGLTNIDDVEDMIEAGLPVEDYDTLSGFILGQLGRIPEADEDIAFEANGYLFEVLQVDEQVITKVRVTRLKKQTETNDS